MSSYEYLAAVDPSEPPLVSLLPVTVKVVGYVTANSIFINFM